MNVKNNLKTKVTFLYKLIFFPLYFQRTVDINPGEYVSLLYKDRMRTVKDKQMVIYTYL